MLAHPAVAETLPADDARSPDPGVAVALSVAAPAAMLAGGALAIGASDSIVFDGAEAVGVLLLATGAITGPSAGHAYTGDWQAAGMFSLGRAASLGVALVGMEGVLSAAIASSLDGGDDGVQAGTEAQAMLVGGLAGWVGLSAWEAVASWGAAERARERARGTKVSVSAKVYRRPTAEGTETHGLGLALSGSY